MTSALGVDELLNLYNTYKATLAKLNTAEASLARTRLSGNKIDEEQSTLNSLTHALQELSDKMTFDTPRIWIEYKYRAYQNETQPITSLHDLRMHCSKAGDICASRFIFFNNELGKIGEKPLTDRLAYPDIMDIADLLATDLTEKIDKATLQAWRYHEYYKDEQGNAAKWQSYE